MENICEKKHGPIIHCVLTIWLQQFCKISKKLKIPYSYDDLRTSQGCKIIVNNIFYLGFFSFYPVFCST